MQILAASMLTLCWLTVGLAQPIHFKRIDKNHSTIGFSASIMKGLSKVNGKFTEFEIELIYDEKDIQNSSINVKIDLSSVDTGISDRDNHLKSEDFFYVGKFPHATFVSKRIERRGDQHLVIGDFSLRGITRETEVPFTVTGLSRYQPDEAPAEMRAIMGAEAGFTIDRLDYGMKWQHNLVEMFVSHEVTVEINLLTRSTKIE